MTAARLAVLGGPPAFAAPIHVAQVNLPAWDRVETAFRAIFDRRHFANHGPLVEQLDRVFAERTGVAHAVAVTNGTVALMAMACALDQPGEVIVPAFTFPATVQALQWAGMTPVLCDVDRQTHMLTADLVRPLINRRTVAVLGVHLWGGACDPDGLEALARHHGIALLFDACHSTGCAHGGRPIGGFGTAEAFSFHATKIVNAGEGGCITTNDAAWAQRLRTIRNFHHQHTYAPVAARLNGKMSEAQAALALLSLDDLPSNIEANRLRRRAYLDGLTGLRGATVVGPGAGGTSNHQYVVVDVDAASCGVHRDHLLAALNAENIVCRRHFYPGIHRTWPHLTGPSEAAGFPVTDLLCDRILQLPNGQGMSTGDVERVCEIIRAIVERAEEVTAALTGVP